MITHFEAVFFVENNTSKRYQDLNCHLKLPPTWDLDFFQMITHFEAVFFVENNTSKRYQDFHGHQNIHSTVLSKTENCSGVNSDDAVLSDSANTLDFEFWILERYLNDCDPLHPQVLSYGILPWYLLSCILTRPDWRSWGTRLNRGDMKSLCYWHARAWGVVEF